MANTWFQFQQFRIEQDKCGMKVSTDACVFGVLVAQGIDSDTVSALDIGTGTGLLSLIIAQEHPLLRIDAVEVEEQAYLQALHNTSHSKWADNIRVHHSSIQAFYKKSSEKYNVIICNPPFFTQHLKSTNQQRSIARHNDILPLNDLLEAVEALLSFKGRAFVLLPETEELHFDTVIQDSGLFIRKKVMIYPKVSGNCNRIIFEIGFEKETTIEIQWFYIKNKDGSNTDAYDKLMRDYLLCEK